MEVFQTLHTVIKEWVAMKILVSILKTTFKYWLGTAIIITSLIFFISVVVQQVIRQSANDPQVQMAEDTAAKLASGQSAQDIVPKENVNIASSLATYMIIFDDNGNPIASSAQLNGQTPTIPSGVFNSVRKNGEDRITWQPQDGVRSAVVVTQFKGANSGFVLAGRSLRETEKQEDNIMNIFIFGWLFTLLLTLPIVAIMFRKPMEAKPL